MEDNVEVNPESPSMGNQSGAAQRKVGLGVSISGAAIAVSPVFITIVASLLSSVGVNTGTPGFGAVAPFLMFATVPIGGVIAIIGAIIQSTAPKG